VFVLFERAFLGSVTLFRFSLLVYFEFLSPVRYRLQATRMGIELPTWSTTPTTISFSDGMHGDAEAKFTILMVVLVDLPSGHLTWPARLAKDNERFGHLTLFSACVTCVPREVKFEQ
jgi:hypothetical protein